MRTEEIEKALSKRKQPSSPVQIRFKTRPALKGLFLHTKDYEELSQKNLWRIVSEMNIDIYRQSGDENLARIFNGTEFTKLEMI
ncbi:MAG: short-chain dehydrogenase [Chitinophagaceae bacterium]|nr:short-chain dehydrogenase [Chitinophagaceae bacterium]